MQNVILSSPGPYPLDYLRIQRNVQPLKLKWKTKVPEINEYYDLFISCSLYGTMEHSTGMEEFNLNFMKPGEMITGL